MSSPNRNLYLAYDQLDMKADPWPVAVGEIQSARQQLWAWSLVVTLRLHLEFNLTSASTHKLTYAISDSYAELDYWEYLYFD